MRLRKRGVKMVGEMLKARGLRVGLCRMLLAIVIFLCMTATALAVGVSPPNDNRAGATVLGPLPQTVRGTTVGATDESTEPDSHCAAIGGSVWYSLSVGSSPPDRIGLKLSANGNLDAVLDVYERHRSQISPVDCAATDTSGRTAVAFTPTANTTYLIRVAQQSDSVSGVFSLNALALPAPPSAPGPYLPGRGAEGVLDGTLATTAAYSMRLTAGITYKVNLFKPNDGCMRLRLFPPGTHSFDASSLAGLSCAGYRLFTPRVSGLWSFLIVAASSNRGRQLYGLHVAPASANEMAPGVRLPNLTPISGHLRGNLLDVVRLFRFDVVQRSDLELDLMAGYDAPFDLKLLDDQGRYLQCNCGSTGQETIRRQISPGRYFVVVQAHSFGSGPFTLTLKLRLITHVNVTFDGNGYEEVAPGRMIEIAAQVTPVVDGPVTIEIDSFDPVERWQFYRVYHVRAVNGLAQISFRPPHIGRWRASVSYDGTSTASPATSGVAQALVAGPLVR
jgi:hypothetical protein